MESYWFFFLFSFFVLFFLLLVTTVNVRVRNSASGTDKQTDRRRRDWQTLVQPRRSKQSWNIWTTGTDLFGSRRVENTRYRRGGVGETFLLFFFFFFFFLFSGHLRGCNMGPSLVECWRTGISRNDAGERQGFFIFIFFFFLAPWTQVTAKGSAGYQQGFFRNATVQTLQRMF